MKTENIKFNFSQIQLGQMLQNQIHIQHEINDIMLK